MSDAQLNADTVRVPLECGHCGHPVKNHHGVRCGNYWRCACGCVLLVEDDRSDGDEFLGTCDWGDCDEPAESRRYDPEGKRWLPVCPAHSDGDPHG